MSEIFSRNELFWGDEVQKKLTRLHVIVFGLGGVGGYSAEALARCGIGELTLVDFDTVSPSNINRQIVALNSTVGINKTSLFEKRLFDINPDIKLNLIENFYDENMKIPSCDYIIDAIDTMRSKVDLLSSCYNNKIPVISSMGAGNRIDPTQLYVCDIFKIENKKAPFVSNILYQLEKKGIKSGIEVVVSREKPKVKEKISALEQIVTKNGEKIEFNKIIPSSTPFVAPVAGIIMAGRVVQNLCGV